MAQVRNSIGRNTPARSRNWPKESDPTEQTWREEPGACLVLLYLPDRECHSVQGRCAPPAQRNRHRRTDGELFVEAEPDTGRQQTVCISVLCPLCAGRIGVLDSSTQEAQARIWNDASIPLLVEHEAGIDTCTNEVLAVIDGQSADVSRPSRQTDEYLRAHLSFG